MLEGIKKFLLPLNYKIFDLGSQLNAVLFLIYSSIFGVLKIFTQAVNFVIY